MIKELDDTTEIRTYGYGVTDEVSDDGCRAVVRRNGKIVKRFKGETAHMDAARLACDIALDLGMRD